MKATTGRWIVKFKNLVKKGVEGVGGELSLQCIFPFLFDAFKAGSGVERPEARKGLFQPSGLPSNLVESSEKEKTLMLIRGDHVMLCVGRVFSKVVVGLFTGVCAHLGDWDSTMGFNIGALAGGRPGAGEVTHDSRSEVDEWIVIP